MELQVQIETTSTCNAACVFCVYPSAGRHGKLMSTPLYSKIVDELATIPQVTTLALNGLGEPTLDPHLVARVEYAHEVLPSVVIGMYTNGVYMTPSKFDLLKDAGIGYVVFSLNASSPAQHESQMGLKGKFDEVCSNVDYAIANQGEVHVEVKAVVARDFWSLEDTLKFYGRWGISSKGGHGQSVIEGNWAGYGRTVRNFNPGDECQRAVGSVYVTADGVVTTCCFDPTGKQAFGDLRVQSLREVYNSEPYVAFREAHANNKADSYAICASCTRI